MVTAAVRRAAAVGLAACLVASCASPADPGWRRVGLPTGSRPATLARAGDDLLVGGALTSGERPLLARLDGTGRVTPVDITPTTGYARAAELVSLSPLDAEVLALGVARGGAHGNQRWTYWQGPLTGPVRDHDQQFNTFGGHEAGPLLGIVRPGGRPVVVGSRAGSTGFAAALWTLQGATWTRQQPVDPMLVSSPDRVLTFRAATSAGATLLLVGSETGLAGAVRQVPMAWAGSVAGPWRNIPLPIPEELTGAGLAQATSVVCGDEAGTACWVAGWVRGSPVVWQVDTRTGTSTPFVLPGAGGSATDPLAVVALVGESPVVLTNADAPLAAQRCGDDWRTTPAPAGGSTAAVAVGERLYVVASGDDDGALWETVVDLGAC